MGDTLYENIAHDEKQYHHRKNGAGVYRNPGDGCFCLCTHIFAFLLMTENSRFIIMMNTNSTTAVAIRASRCRSAA